MDSVRLGVRSVPLRHLRTIARLPGFCCRDVLHADDRRTLCVADSAAKYGAALSSIRLSDASGAISLARCDHRSAIVALQAAVHLAGTGDYFIRRSGLLAVAESAERATPACRSAFATAAAIAGAPGVSPWIHMV
jgi:hypothetical protein